MGLMARRTVAVFSLARRSLRSPGHMKCVCVCTVSNVIPGECALTFVMAARSFRLVPHQFTMFAAYERDRCAITMFVDMSRMRLHLERMPFSPNAA